MKAKAKKVTLEDRIEATLTRLGDEATCDLIAQRISVKAPKVSAALSRMKGKRVTSRELKGETFFRVKSR